MGAVGAGAAILAAKGLQGGAGGPVPYVGPIEQRQVGSKSASTSQDKASPPPSGTSGQPAPAQPPPPGKSDGRQPDKKKEAELPGLDRSGKVHGRLPDRKDLSNYSKDDLKKFQTDLKASIKERIQKTTELGREKKHGERQGEEQKLVKQIEKVLDKDKDKQKEAK